MSHRPALFRNVTDKRVEHEDDENSNKDVIDRPYVTDLQQLSTTTNTYDHKPTVKTIAKLLTKLSDILIFVSNLQLFH